jgi:hypothetical protein
MQVIELQGIAYVENGRKNIDLTAVVPAYQRGKRNPIDSTTLFTFERTKGDGEMAEKSPFYMEIEALVQWLRYVLNLKGDMRFVLHGPWLIAWQYENLPRTTLPPPGVLKIQSPKSEDKETFDKAAACYRGWVKELESQDFVKLAAGPREKSGLRQDTDLPLIRGLLS